jgi:hypothetical protein
MQMHLLIAKLSIAALRAVFLIIIIIKLILLKIRVRIIKFQDHAFIVVTQTD